MKTAKRAEPAMQRTEIERSRTDIKREQVALSDELARLSSYCNKEDTHWPTSDDLGSILNRVEHILSFTRQRVMRIPLLAASPMWKAFQLLDKRMPKLHLIQRVNMLVKRARERLSEAKEASLTVLSRQAGKGDQAARNLLRDINLVMYNGPSAAKKIDWTQHQTALAQFSPTRSVDLAWNPSSAAPIEVRCYARALELIVELDPARAIFSKSFPLVAWLAGIRHPDVNELKRYLDPVLASGIDQIVTGLQNLRSSHKRDLARERTKRHRAKKFSAGKALHDTLSKTNKKPNKH